MYYCAQVIRGGRRVKLTFQNRKESVAAAIKTRAQECRVQVAAILEGLSAIVPLPLLKLFSAAELKVPRFFHDIEQKQTNLIWPHVSWQRLVCGADTFDLELLKRTACLDGLRVPRHAEWVTLLFQPRA